MTQTLKSGIRKYINDNHLIDIENDTVLLAVSGGLDSIVMLDLMVDLFGGDSVAGQKVAIAHCNFGLRGSESDGDEAFVRKLADLYAIDIHVAKYDTKALAQENSITIQEQARELRYDFFETLSHKYGYNKVVIAHNANDTTETMLINLIRGSGLKGLCGIRPMRDDLYVRPLMFATRDEIREYADANNLDHREDSSNSSIKYLRNYLRHQVIPSLSVAASSHGNLHKLVLQTQQRLQSSQSFIDNSVEIMIQDCMNQEQNVIYIDKLKRWGASIEFQLFAILQSKGYAYSDILSMCKAIEDNHSGAKFYSSDNKFLIITDRQTLVICNADEMDDDSAVHISINSNHDAVKKLITPLTPDKLRNHSPNIIYLNSQAVSFPLILRKWQQGDTFCPLGMKGKSKLVSDLLIDRKLDVVSKKSQLILQEQDSGRIVSVVGIQPDDRFKVVDMLEVIEIDLDKVLTT